MDIADSYVLRESEEFMIPQHSQVMVDKNKLGDDVNVAVFPVKSNWLQLNEDEEKKAGSDVVDDANDGDELA